MPHSFAQLFVSVHAANTRPGQYPATYDKASQKTVGADAVSFSWLEMPECVAAPMPPGSCGLWIAVYGYTNASYNLVAVVSDGGPAAIELLDGVPQAGAVAQGGAAFFYADVDVDPTATYSFYVRALSGDPDLFLTTDGSVPSRTHYNYSSTTGSGDDFVNVRPGDDGYNPSTRAYALVWGYSASAFEVTYASVGAVVALGDGQTARGAGDGDVYNFYSFSVADPSQQLPVTLACTAQLGDPDVR